MTRICSMVGGTLAHADFPPPCGVVTNTLPKPVHFDDSEHTWSDGAVANAFDIETVALHEIGHILGLGHTTVNGAVMFPTVKSNFTLRVLQNDDRDGIRSLYAPLPTGPSATGNDMQPGEVLLPGASITSANGRYRFVYQSDGNLVLYEGGNPLWASNTWGQPVGRVHHADRRQPGDLRPHRRKPDLVVRHVGQPGQPPGAAGRRERGHLPAERRADLVHEHLAAHGTGGERHDMQPGEVLDPGGTITSANGRYTFVYQGDGNLVLYEGGNPLWASNTWGQPVGVCIMQGDGNLVDLRPRRSSDLVLRHVGQPGQPPRAAGRRQRGDLPPGRRADLVHEHLAADGAGRDRKRHAARSGARPGRHDHLGQRPVPVRLPG